LDAHKAEADIPNLPERKCWFLLRLLHDDPPCYVVVIRLAL
jgi:hypothetical protein